MMKLNKNILVFVFCMLFVGVGLCSRDYFVESKKAFHNLINGRASKFTRMAKFENKIDGISSENLFYHDEMMDINSFKENLLGARVVIKGLDTVVKFDSGSMGVKEERIKENEIEEMSSSVERLRTIAKQNGAEFLYCAVPTKQFYESFPSNVHSFAKDNFALLLKTLSNKDIPTLNYVEAFRNSGISDTEIFYYTDHHWQASSGFAACRILCKELNNRYGFNYEEKYTDIKNYSRTLYKDCLLGFRGRQAGRFFTWHGADDFELIVPSFYTYMTEEQPIKNEVREGRFEDSVLFMDDLEEKYKEKDYYNWDPYSVYSGGSYRIQIMKNNLNSDGKKILIIRDSFAMVVTPFLALQTSELHICDVRDNEKYVGEKLNMEKYIKEIKPDYVIVLYNGVSNAQKEYNFF